MKLLTFDNSALIVECHLSSYRLGGLNPHTKYIHSPSAQCTTPLKTSLLLCINWDGATDQRQAEGFSQKRTVEAIQIRKSIPNINLDSSLLLPMVSMELNPEPTPYTSHLPPPPSLCYSYFIMFSKQYVYYTWLLLLCSLFLLLIVPIYGLLLMFLFGKPLLCHLT